MTGPEVEGDDEDVEAIRVPLEERAFALLAVAGELVDGSEAIRFFNSKGPLSNEGCRADGGEAAPRLTPLRPLLKLFNILDWPNACVPRE